MELGKPWKKKWPVFMYNQECRWGGNLYARGQHSQSPWGALKEDDDVSESMVLGEQKLPELVTAEGEQKDMVSEEVAINRREANAESQARRSQHKRRTPSYLKDYLTVWTLVMVGFIDQNESDNYVTTDFIVRHYETITCLCKNCMVNWGGEDAVSCYVTFNN